MARAYHRQSAANGVRIASPPLTVPPRPARLGLVAAIAIAVAVAVYASGFGQDRGDRTARSLRPASGPPATHDPKPVVAPVLRVRRIARLPAAVQDAAVAVESGRAYIFGGLDA